MEQNGGPQRLGSEAPHPTLSEKRCQGVDLTPLSLPRTLLLAGPEEPSWGHLLAPQLWRFSLAHELQ